MFMVPRDLDKNNLPKPNASDIQFTEMPAKTVAAIRFGGWANSEKIEKYKNKLISALKKEGVVHTNTFYFLGYNPPYETINRRNEVIVELLDFVVD
jgi:effector-binding domain-containing protein